MLKKDNITEGFKLSFKPAQATRALLVPLPERARDVIERRYGLVGKSGEGMTLDAIGQIYGITRERVRQIENFALAAIRKAEAYTKAKDIFDELEDYLASHGGLIKEEMALDELAHDQVSKNHISFLLALGDSFVRLKEDEHFHHRWTTDEETTEKVHAALTNLHESLTSDDLIAEADMVARFLEHLREDLKEYATAGQARKWLELSKHISSNPLGEWGLANSPNIRTRGVRDYSYLVLRKHGEPLHFSEVAKQIEEMFDRPAHVATTHNELIKDDRFVLVGRGLYALSEWGYTSGVVRDIIKNIIKEQGPLSKEELTKQVLKQRQVKENTIYVNLQNPRYFKKDSRNRYTLAN